MEFVDRGILEADLDGMVFAYDCRKSYDIFRVACDCRKDVVALIYTTQFVLKAWR